MGCVKTNGAGSLIKTGCKNGWNGGAISQRSTKGDTAVEFRCTRAQYTMLGLAKGDSHKSYTDIDCAIYCSQGTTHIYELGRHRYRGKSYGEETTFKIVRKGTRVQYFQDDKLLRTCGNKLSGSVNVDTSIHNQGRGGILSAWWVGPPPPPPPPPPSQCPGDADGNKKVDIEDLLILLGTYGKKGAGLKADFKVDKKIDVEDLLIILGNYGKTCTRKPSQVNTKYLKITQDGPVGQNRRGNSWDLMEVECWDLTRSNRKIKISPYSASHDHYNNKYPTSNLVDGNKNTFWAGHPGQCSYYEHGGCQTVTLEFDQPTKNFKCTLSQHKKDARWAVEKITIAQSEPLDTPKFTLPIKWKLKRLGDTPNIMACTAKTCKYKGD